MTRRFAFVLFSVLVVWPALVVPGVAQEGSLRGFSAGEARSQRDWEQKYRALPDGSRLREYMSVIAQEPHHAGSPAGRKVAGYILGKFREWGLQAELEEFQVLLPFPRERVVELVAPEKYTAALKEPAVLEDSDSTDENQLPTFNAYSADGDVTAQLVYVNYGVPDDYEQLKKMGVDVRGKIVIARYGGSWRGIKPKLAWENGAAGCLIYSDPKDDGYYRGPVYPEGPYRPAHGVQRGSVLDMPLHAGDPLTPGWAAVGDARRLSRSEAPALMKIPVLPISYADAEPLLKNLRGEVAPESWRGALPVTYHVGPGPATVRLKTAFDWSVRPVYNVIGRIPGAAFPDEWVIYGNHHDAWVSGASDPTSGNAVLMETARGLAELSRQGWRPKRTIILASWDAEEWGLLGSTEWTEKHAAELGTKAVAYINSDSSGRGVLSMGGSHSLERFVNDVSRDVGDPASADSVWEAARKRRLENARTEDDRKQIAGRPDLRIAALGSGSDYTPFLQHLGIASMNLGFSGDSSGGVYHSIYDSFHWYTKFSDTNFIYGRALAQWMGTALMRLAGAQALPFEFNNLAETVARYAGELEKLQRKENDVTVDLAPLREGVEALKRSANAYESRFAAATLDGDLAALNRALIRVERAMITQQGLPRRPWYKHQLYAPGAYTGYAVKTLPGVREAIEAKRWEEAREQIGVLRGVLLGVARAIDEAAARLR